MRHVLQKASVIMCMALLFTGCGSHDRALQITTEAEHKAFLDGAADDYSVTESQSGQQKTDSGLMQNGPQETGTQQQEMGEEEVIFVHVCGAVANPGVVAISKDSRVEDALLAAGGFTEEAQREYVNLAAKVQDGQQIFFPTLEEAVALEKQQSAKENGLVNINTADITQLCTLPGIGQARAQDILQYREKHGAFQNKEDIMKVPGIKQNAYDKLCDKITLD